MFTGSAARDMNGHGGKGAGGKRAAGGFDKKFSAALPLRQCGALRIFRPFHLHPPWDIVETA